MYVHNALPFCEHKFSFKEDKLLWVYQSIIGKLIKNSIKKANKVIVQNEWMKDEIVNRVKVDGKKVQVNFPDVTILPDYKYTKPDKKVFFYPANSSKFKNHRVILDACIKLRTQGISDYSVVFTLRGDENPEIKDIYDKGIKLGLGFEWVGTLSREQVFEWYEKSILLFPSYIETVGLPIYEAIGVGCPVIVSNCRYVSKYITEYKDVSFARYNVVDDWVNNMRKYL